MYTLDFQTIRQVMQAHQQTGTLHAETPTGIASLREPCRVEINILVGNVVACTVVGVSERRVTGEKAAQELSRLGRLNWTFVPKQEAATPPESFSPAPGEIIFFPQRTVNLSQQQMRSLPRMHRAIFVLADGTKSIAKIADMLSTSPDVVERALRDLQSMGVIVIRQQGGRN
ncbi:MAG TPA: helix-turn-helix domain-containing protein [Ktedonobacteraceae bacterium]|jgi:hypothetical protein